MGYYDMVRDVYNPKPEPVEAAPCPHEWREISRDYIHNNLVTRYFQCQKCSATRKVSLNRDQAAELPPMNMTAANALSQSKSSRC